MPEVGDEDFINKFGRNGIPMRHKVPAFFTISTSGLVLFFMHYYHHYYNIIIIY